MTGLAQRPLARVAGEVALIGLLLAAWVITWLSLDRFLQNLTETGRALYLVNEFTNEKLGLAFVLGILVVLALPLRHRSPMAALFVVGSLAILLEWLFPLLARGGLVVRLTVAIAVVWSTWRLRNWWITVGVLVPLIAVSGIRAFQVNERFEAINSAAPSVSESVSQILQEILFYGASIMVGLAIRRVGEQRAELEERNRELVSERAKASEAAVLDERLRISRELHDVVAHHVTTMTVHAGAARQVVETSPEKATESLRHIESAGRNAVSELHQLLGFLRNSDSGGVDGGDRAPTPSLRHLAALESSFGSKLECSIEVDGDLEAVPGAVDVSAYRIIQEALTNTLKHSTANSARINLDVGADALTVLVDDDGETRPGTSAPGGHGLVGMRERALLHGGTMTAGPQPAGHGWRVHAELPYGGRK